MRGDIVEGIFEMHALGRGRLLHDRHAHPPFPRGADRPCHKSPSAIRTDICKLALDAIGAERAFIAANASLLRGGRKVLIAILAVWPKLQRHARNVLSRDALSWQIGGKIRRSKFPQFQTCLLDPIAEKAFPSATPGSRL